VPSPWLSCQSTWAKRLPTGTPNVSSRTTRASRRRRRSGVVCCYSNQLEGVRKVGETSHICFLSDTYEGAVPDKSLAELANSTPPLARGLYQEGGLQGFSSMGSRSFNRRKSLLEVNSPHLSKRSIVRARRSACALNTRLAV
jgi:hypothetical protein